MRRDVSPLLRRIPATTVAAVLTAALVGLALVPAFATDAFGQSARILRKSANAVNANEITRDDISKFTYVPSSSSRATDLEVTDVLDVIWQNTGPDEPSGYYANALEMVAASDFENAITSLEAARAKTDNEVFGRYVTRELVRAHLLAGAGDPSSTHNRKAAEIARGFLDDNAGARLAGDVRLLMGRAQMQAGNHVEAEQTLKGLENEARAKFGLDVEIRAKHWGARNLEAKGRFAEAKNLYASLATTADSAMTTVGEGSLLRRQLEELKRTGQIRQGACMISDGDVDGAARYFGSLLSAGERAKDAGLIAGARNGLGMVAFERGDIEKARLEFVRVSVQYFHDPEQTLMALYWIARCYEELDGDEPGARARAAKYYREVVERNASTRLNSPWAAKAKQKI